MSGDIFVVSVVRWWMLDVLLMKPTVCLCKELVCLCRCNMRRCYHPDRGGSHGAVSCTACVACSVNAARAANQSTWHVLSWCSTNRCSSRAAWAGGIDIAFTSALEHASRVDCKISQVWVINTASTCLWHGDTYKAILICSWKIRSCHASVSLTSSWPHLRCDVGLKEGEYKWKLSLSYSIVYYYNGAQRYEQFLQVGWLYRALISLDLALRLPSASVSLVLMVLYRY